MWSAWMFKKLNGYSKSTDTRKPATTYKMPLDGKTLCLELIYGWSAIRFSIAAVVPLILSLAIGIWYMKHFDDVVGAWTISLYIVTSAAGESKT
jgi:hypothetical protein